MELFLRDGDGNVIPIREVQGLDRVNGVLLLQTSVNFVDAKTRLQIERDLACRVGCPVVVLDNYLRVVGSCKKEDQPCTDVKLPPAKEQFQNRTIENSNGTVTCFGIPSK